MLKILIGTDWKANTDAVMEMIARDIQQKKPNRILMVPELVSHTTERTLARVGGDSACLYAEVLSFTRLVRHVAEQEHLQIAVVPRFFCLLQITCDIFFVMIADVGNC